MFGACEAIRQNNIKMEVAVFEVGVASEMQDVVEDAVKRGDLLIKRSTPRVLVEPSPGEWVVNVVMGCASGVARELTRERDIVGWNLKPQWQPETRGSSKPAPWQRFPLLSAANSCGFARATKSMLRPINS